MPKLLAEAILENAQRTPDACAIVDANGSVSYAELANAMVAFASSVQEEHVPVVTLEASHTIEFAVAMLGCYHAGVCVAYTEHGLGQVGVASVCRKLGTTCHISHEPVEGLRHIPLKGVLAAPGNNSASSRPRADSLAEVLFTTGTTGASKGVMLSQDNVIAVLENIIDAIGMPQDNVEYIAMPLNHVFALRRLQANLYRGATAVLRDDFRSVKSFFEVVRTHQVNALALVPSAISYLLAISGDMLGSLDGQIRYVESSSAPLGQSEKDRMRHLLPHARLFNFYGCTESTACCVLEYSTQDRGPSCVGRPTRNARIRILDDEGNTLVPAEENKGRVAIEGSANMQGYWNDPDATARALRAEDTLVLTNDLGYLDAQGCLHVLGRMDDVVSIGGNKVAPDEVEQLILPIEQVDDCCLVGIPDEVAGSRLVLFAVSDIDAQALAKVVEDALATQVEEFKIPRDVRIVDSIPRTSNGKPLRRELRGLATGA